MKKLFSCSLCLIFCSLLFSFSQSFSSNNYSKETTSESTILKKGDLSKLINPVELSGEFRIWRNISGEVVFYTETENDIFLFSCKDCNLNLNLINSKEEGTLTYLDHAFVFKTKNDTFYFAVEKPEEKLIKSGFGLSFDKENQNYGIGIVQSHFSKEIKTERNNFYEELKKSSKLSEYLTSIFGTASDCQNGGYGSSSCSMGNGGCSVSCINGYYACCNPGNCECIERSGTKPIG